MVDHRPGFGHRAPTPPATPPGEIGVLVVGEPPGVEHPDLRETRRRQQHTTARPARHLLGHEPIAVTLAVVAFESLAPSGERQPEAVDPSMTGTVVDPAQGDHLSRTLGRVTVTLVGEANVLRTLASHRDRDLDRQGRDRHLEFAPLGDLVVQRQRSGRVRYRHEPIPGEAPPERLPAGDLHRHDSRPGGRRTDADQRDRHERVGQQDLRSDRTDARPRPHPLHHRRQPTRIDGGVVVDQGQCIDAVEVAHRTVAPLGESEIRAVANDAHLGELPGESLDRAVDRAVVDHDHLEPIGGVVGGEQRFDAPRREARCVPVQYDDPDERPFHARWRRGHCCASACTTSASGSWKSRIAASPLPRSAKLSSTELVGRVAIGGASAGRAARNSAVEIGATLSGE